MARDPADCHGHAGPCRAPAVLFGVLIPARTRSIFARPSTGVRPPTFGGGAGLDHAPGRPRAKLGVPSAAPAMIPVAELATPAVIHTLRLYDGNQSSDGSVSMIATMVAFLAVGPAAADPVIPACQVVRQESRALPGRGGCLPVPLSRGARRPRLRRPVRLGEAAGQFAPVFHR